jgi:tetratricopeptide (TPR) repeat protein
MSAPETTGTKAGTPISREDRDWMEWLQQHGRTAAFLAGAVVVVAAGVWLYVSSEARKESFASQALTQARASAESGNLPLAASDLNRLVDRFGGTAAADEAVILLNQIRLLQGQRDAAVQALQQFVRGGHADHVKASAYALLGGGLEDQGKIREAGNAYQEASRAARLDFLKAQYLLDAGRTLAASGDTAGARASYAEVLQKYGELSQAAEARVRMAEMGGEVPPPPKPRRQGTTSG